MVFSKKVRKRTNAKANALTAKRNTPTDDNTTTTTATEAESPPTIPSDWSSLIMGHH